MERSEGRSFDETRNIEFLPPMQMYAKGSVIIRSGNTLVNCSVSIENKVPPFLDPETDGWLSAEYSMLPTATHSRSRREAAKGKLSGRTMEIQRLIGRSLRQCVDLNKIPGKTIWVDCDVLQADGGTRTASISGASVALNIALNKLVEEGQLDENPFVQHVGAISVGLKDGAALLDLDYKEDSSADVDMNVVMTSNNEFIELQATSEGKTFSDEDFQKMLTLARKGIKKIFDLGYNFLEK